MCVCVCVCACSVAQSRPLFVPPSTVALQAPLSMGFPKEEHRSGLPFPTLASQKTEPQSLATLQHLQL